MENKSAFILYRNKLKSLLRRAEKEYYTEKISSCQKNLNETWKIIKRLINSPKADSTPNTFTVNGSTVSGNENVANAFNQFFVNIGSQLARKITPSSVDFKTYLSHSFKHSFGLYFTDQNELVSICSTLKQKDSTGHDGISSSIIKKSMVNIVDLLTHIINCSLRTGIVPSSLKIAKVVPIFKSGQKDQLVNYRPISVLPFFSKLLEKVVYNRLISYLNKWNILVQNQFGFRSNRSTCMAVIDMCDKISQALDENKYAAGIFIDLSKAFDTVNHSILLKKLESYGIRGSCLDWFTSYLSNRYQFVAVNGAISTRQLITCGVPQGSILGPLLFLIYINDITACSDMFKFILFADDTNLFLSNKSLTELENIVNIELEKLSVWFKANKLSLNIGKTHYILFRNKGKKMNNNLTIKIDGTKIDQVCTTKFLGLYIDEGLTWANHISYISSKISKNIGIIHRLSRIVPSHVLTVLYNTLILPYLSYCNIVWASNYPSRLKPLELLQKRAIRILCKADRLASTSDLFKQKYLLKLCDINTLHIALFMYKYHHHLLPANFDDYFVLTSHVYEHYTRSSVKSNYFSLRVRTNIRKFSIKFSGPLTWNNIPTQFKLSASVVSLKNNLTRTFINNY